MQRGGRIAIASLVLLAGTMAALLFRRPPAPDAVLVQQHADSLLLRKDVGPQNADSPSERPPARIESQAAHRLNDTTQPPAILLPMDPGQDPPDLAKSYPGLGPSDATRAPSQQTPGGGNSLRTHRIVDGDSLGAMAQRYLGRADRSVEIYEANKDVLSSPALLPIGAVLKIPPTDNAP